MSPQKLIETYVNELGLDVIERTYKLKVNRYLDKNLYVLNYSNRSTCQSDPVVDQCRGVILSYDDKTEKYFVVCRPFNRFFSHIYQKQNGKHVFNSFNANFDFSLPFNVYEKVDGSLMKIYHFNGRWEIGSKQTAFAEGPLFNTSVGSTYSDLAIKTFGLKDYEEFQEMMKDQRTDLTYMVEMIGPENKIIMEYKKPEMVFLSAMDTKRAVEVKIDTFPNSRLPILYDSDVLLNHVHMRMSYFNEWFSKIGTDEGFVIVNGNGVKAKYKNPKYLKLCTQPKPRIEKPKRSLSKRVFGALIRLDPPEEHKAEYERELKKILQFDPTFLMTDNKSRQTSLLLFLKKNEKCT